MDYTTHCGNNGVVFNPEKFHFAEKVMEFAGFRIAEDRINPTERMTEAILSFHTPKNIANISSWFIMVNQVPYGFSQAEEIAPFLELLKKKTRNSTGIARSILSLENQNGGSHKESKME